MSPEKHNILSRLILAGGPPRGGTTILTNLLNWHPKIVAAIDNMVYENWGLYYYRTRVGLVQKLRSQKMTAGEAQHDLLDHIHRDGYIWGAAPSEKVIAYPLAPPPVRPDFTGMPNDHRLVRHLVPLKAFQDQLCLCLKSPEISFVLPKLSAVFRQAKFVLVYRPVIEIAESMYRKGFEWGDSYHRRWINELDENGELEAPPGIPEEWHALWKTVSDFQRCVIYATSYLRAIVSGIQEISSYRFFLYNHAKLRKRPTEILVSLADFLGLDFAGFKMKINKIHNTAPCVAPELKAEYSTISLKIGTQKWMKKLELNAKR
jgi:hypothetical protein